MHVLCTSIHIHHTHTHTNTHPHSDTHTHTATTTITIKFIAILGNSSMSHLARIYLIQSKIVYTSTFCASYANSAHPPESFPYSKCMHVVYTVSFRYPMIFIRLNIVCGVCVFRFFFHWYFDIT